MAKNVLIGGYPEGESGLADLAMRWMLEEARTVEHSLIVDPSKLKLAPFYKAMQHDERSGSGWFWREGTREAFSPGAFHGNDVELRFREAEVVFPTGAVGLSAQSAAQTPHLQPILLS